MPRVHTALGTTRLDLGVITAESSSACSAFEDSYELHIQAEAPGAQSVEVELA